MHKEIILCAQDKIYIYIKVVFWNFRGSVEIEYIDVCPFQALAETWQHPRKEIHCQVAINVLFKANKNTTMTM